MSEEDSQPLPVSITREPFSDFLVLKLEDGQMEELDPDETRAWFDDRGANMYEIEKVLDYVWNFYQADVVISNPKKPTTRVHPTSPII